MPRRISLVRVIIGTAACASLLASMAAGVTGSVPGVWFGAISAAMLLAVILVDHRHGWWVGQAVLNEATPRAEAGRRRALYERETGLFAHWYVSLRGEEECKRAARYHHPLVLLLVEPAPSSHGPTVQGQLTQWLGKHMRSVDITGYLGDGCYVVLMPDTDLASAKHPAGRLRRDIAGAKTSLSAFGADGTTFDQLYAIASQRLGRAANQAA